MDKRRTHARGEPLIVATRTAANRCTLGRCVDSAAPMSSTDLSEMVQRLAELRVEHRDLDVAIHRMATHPGCNQLELTRLKKRKLMLKDAITRLESRLIPDLDA